MAEIEFGSELSMLAKTAQDWLRKHSTFQAVRAAMETESGFDAGLWQQLTSLGLLGIAAPEAYGGAAMGAAGLVPVAEAMGRYLYSGPWLASTLASQLLQFSADGTAKEAWLGDMVRGSCLGTVALSEPSGSFLPLDLDVRAQAVGGGYTLHGAKCGVLCAAQADVILISARVDGAEPALFLVERRHLPADALQRERLVDETRRSYRLTLKGQGAVRLGGDASAALRAVSHLGSLLMAADMSGGLQGSLELTLEYLRTRTQFGKPIGGYQALKHPMVDILIASEQGRSLLYHAATVFEGESQASEVAVRMAKAHCGEAFTYGADRSIQFHGAIGFTYECHAQLFLRRAQWSEYQFGDALHHRNQLQALLLDEAFNWEEGGGSAGAL